MNEKSFKTGILFLSEAYGKKLKDEIISMYWEILKEYSDVEFKKMLEGLIKTFIPTSQVPFPLIPHFLEAVGDNVKTKAQLAVMAVKNAIAKVGPYNSVTFGDRALHETIHQFGGWVEICEWDQEKWQFNEKRFLSVYDAACSSGQGADRLIGIHERENMGKNVSDFTEEQKKFLEDQKKPVEISWKGFKQIGNTDKKMIESQPEQLCSVLNSLLAN